MEDFRIQTATTFFFFDFPNYQKQNESYRKPDCQRKDGVSNASGEVVQKSPHHQPKHHGQLFADIEKAEVACIILCFWDKFGIGRPGQALDSTHHQPDPKPREVKMHGRLNKETTNADHNPKSHRYGERGNIFDFLRDPGKKKCAGNAHIFQQKDGDDK